MRALGFEDGDITFQLVDRLASVQQRVQQRVRFFFGTWFLDTQRGTPYVQDVFGRQPDRQLTERAIEQQIRGVPDVTDVTDMRVVYDFQTRTLTFEAVVHTPFGTFTATGTPAPQPEPVAPVVPEVPIVPPIGDMRAFGPAFSAAFG